MCPSEIGVIILIIIIGVAVSIMIRKQATSTASSMTEGFTTNSPQKRQTNFPNITFCPFNSTAVITNAGETLCCHGETSTKLGCLQKTICSLSNSQGKNYGPCSKVYGEYIRNMSRWRCPISMPSYFEKRDPANKNAIIEKGCYAGATNPNKYEPVSNEQPKCIMYDSLRDSDMKINSCRNQVYLDNWKKNPALRIFKNPKLSFVRFRENSPPILQIISMVQQPALDGAIEMPEVTYTWASLIRHWKYAWPDYSKYNFDDLTAENLRFVFEVNHALRLNTLKPNDKKLQKTFLKVKERFN